MIIFFMIFDIVNNILQKAKLQIREKPLLHIVSNFTFCKWKV